MRAARAAQVRPLPSTAEGTRQRLLATAERLFAEEGLSVSNRQIGEAAGQSNNSVVGYHFGTKADLALAIVRSHATDIERRREVMLATRGAPADLRFWLDIVVRPITDHIDALGAPTFYARFVAQATSDPVLRPLLHDETLAAATMREPFQAVSRMLQTLPKHVFAERSDMTRYIVVTACAERERALHHGLPTPRASWSEAASGIVDALAGLWSARVARPHPTPIRSTTRSRS